MLCHADQGGLKCLSKLDVSTGVVGGGSSIGVLLLFHDLRATEHTLMKAYPSPPPVD
jgi:hypothetical protein